MSGLVRDSGLGQAFEGGGVGLGSDQVGEPRIAMLLFQDFREPADRGLRLIVGMDARQPLRNGIVAQQGLGVHGLAGSGGGQKSGGVAAGLAERLFARP